MIEQLVAILLGQMLNPPLCLLLFLGVVGVFEEGPTWSGLLGVVQDDLTLLNRVCMLANVARVFRTQNVFGVLCGKLLNQDGPRT